MALPPCDPCTCIPDNITDDKFKQDVENVLCQTLTALGYAFPEGDACNPCACIQGNIPNDKFKQDVEILLCLILANIGGGGGGGSVTSFSFSNANGISGVVTNPTTTPDLTLTLGAITPTSVAASGTVTGSNLSGTNTGNQTITLTGDVTGSGTGSFAATIANDAVTFAKFQNITTARLLGRATAGSGDMEEITLGTNLSFTGTTLNAAGSGGTVTSVSVTTANGVSGVVADPTTTPAITLTLGAITPASVAAVGTVTGSNLSGTNTGDQTITLTGDVTGSGTGSFAATIANDAVTFAKIQNITTARLLGRATAGSGDTEEITLGTNLSFTGTTLNAAGSTFKFLGHWGADEGWPPATNMGTLAVYPTATGMVPILNFDDTTVESMVFGGVMPSNYTGGNIIVYVEWGAVAVTGTVGWDATFARILAGTTDMNAISFATAQAITDTTVAGTAGIPLVTNVTCTAGAAGTASIAALDKFLLRIRSVLPGGKATGDRWITDVYIYEV